MRNLTSEESLCTQVQDVIQDVYSLLKLLDGYCAHNPENDNSAVYINVVLVPAIEKIEKIIEKF